MKGWTQAVAFDYDGTLALHGRVTDDARKALADARAGGLMLLLVTGRRAPEMHRIFPQSEELFDAVVSENGALLAVRGSILRLAPVLPVEFSARLTKLGVDYELGDCILSCDISRVRDVTDTIAQLKLDLQVVPNRGRVMVLPAGVSKASGLNAALYQLGLSPHNVIAVGDAENDVDMFNAVGTGVAVGNAVDYVKSCADVVLDRPGGEGVAELVCGRAVGKWGPLDPAPKSMQIGQFADGSNVLVPAAMANVLIRGASNAGKSTLAGLLVEGWNRLAYRVLIIDPEGDYVGLGELPGVVVLGAGELPSEKVLGTLLRWGGLSVVLDLSTMDADETRAYLAQLGGMITRLREACGMPHWVVLDEAHVPLGRRGPMKGIRLRDTGFALVTYQPAGLSKLDDSRFDVVLTAVARDAGKRRQVLISDADHDCVPFLPDDRRTRHVRHWHKYFGANLPENHWFWFNWPDGRTYHTARNVDEFAATLADAPVPVLEKHLRAGDFSRWLRGMKSQDLGEIVLDVEVNFQKKHLNAEQARERVIAPFASLFGLSDAPAGVTE